MDADRFDRWTRLLARRMSRRTVAASLGAVTIASLSSPQWVLGQDDDDDQDSDVDQHKDNPTGEDPDDDNQGDDGGDDTADDDGGDDADQDDLDSGWDPCKDVTRCKAVQLDWSSGNSVYWDLGPIPGGPYAQHWSTDPFGCQISDHTEDELREICKQAYPSNPDPMKVTCFSTEDGCEPCADFAAIGCR
jgi:hypothetical protein